ncbi:MAG: signal peptidase I [Candidatus Sulfotelmatobacter sp.]
MPDPISYSPENAKVSDQASGNRKKRRILAALFSSFIPGLGHFLLNQRHKAATLLTTSFLILLVIVQFRLPAFRIAWPLIGWAWFGFALYAGCGALQSRSYPASKPSKWWLLAVLIVALVSDGLLLRTTASVAGFARFGINGSAMEPTIKRGDQVMTDLRYYRSRAPGRGEILMIRQDGDVYCRRIVGESGDTILVKDGLVFLNGSHLDESYVQHVGNPAPSLDNFGPIVVPDGKYFVMGDNRDVSRDSRLQEFGFVDKESILGRTLYLFNVHGIRWNDIQ